MSKVFIAVCLFYQTISQQVSANRPAWHSASRPTCSTQMLMVSVINWWPMTVTSLPHWPSTKVYSTRDDKPFQRYDWCPPKLKCSHDLTMPLSGIVYHPWPSNCYWQPVYSMWSLLSPFTMKIWKAIKNGENGVVWS